VGPRSGLDDVEKREREKKKEKTVQGCRATTYKQDTVVHSRCRASISNSTECNKIL
jgi:hypothetical protein